MIVVHLIRKPLSEGNVASNVLKWGTGALNIDASRIVTGDNLTGGAYAKSGTPRDDGWGMQRAGAGEFQQPTGRWPANVIFSHLPECRQEGTQLKPQSYGGEDGLETAAAWECAPGCPVADLDGQSGVLQSGGKQGSVYGRQQEPTSCYGKGLSGGTAPAISDKGGASRFFKQVSE